MTVAVTVAATTVQVSVTDNQISVTLHSAPVAVSLATVGPQGPPGPAGTGLVWNEYSASVTMAAGHGYLMNNTSRLTATLPANAKQFDEYAIAGKGIGGWMIAQNPGQTIHVEGLATTTGTGGWVMSQTYTDTLRLMCITDATDFLITQVNGNILGN